MHGPITSDLIASAAQSTKAAVINRQPLKIDWFKTVDGFFVVFRQGMEDRGNLLISFEFFSLV